MQSRRNLGAWSHTLPTELGVSKVDTHGEGIGGRAVLGLDLDVCALHAIHGYRKWRKAASPGQRTWGIQPNWEKAPFTTAASTLIAAAG